MERRDYDAGAERSRNWKDSFCEVMYAVNLILAGVVIGIGLCKFVPGFWWFVNWGISV